MIQIPQFRPPANFDNQVRNPGLRFLRRTPRPTNDQWGKHNFWRYAHDDLYNLYHGICAYCASWTPRGKGTNSPDKMTSIDHFVPKSHVPTLAYEWSNYRLCRARINASKGERTDIIDPFQIHGDWFIIDFYTFLISANGGLPPLIETNIENTITALELNHNDFVEQRIDVIKGYSLGLLNFGQVQEKFPFIAYEMTRQRFDEDYLDDMRAYFLAIQS
jgi:hypothetical protein